MITSIGEYNGLPFIVTPVWHKKPREQGMITSQPERSALIPRVQDEHHPRRTNNTLVIINKSTTGPYLHQC